MSDPDSTLSPSPEQVLAVVIAGLWPTSSAAERLRRARQALGLEPVAPWGDRMVYVEAREE